MVFVRKDLFVIYVRFILEMKMKRNSTNNVGVFLAGTAKSLEIHDHSGVPESEGCGAYAHMREADIVCCVPAGNNDCLVSQWSAW